MAESAEAAPALEVVGRSTIEGRGLNAALALAGHCAFVGSRGQGAVAVVDVADPATPRNAGSIPGRPSTTARELRAVEGQRLLVVMSYALAAGGVNRFDLFGWQSDCTHPNALGSFTFATGAPHEFFLWRDPARPQRILLFTTMFGSANPDLRVIDISEPTHPLEAGGWQPPAGPLHSISIDSAGRAYLSLWTSGLAVADASDFTEGRQNPRIRLLTPADALLPPLRGGNVHSAVVGRDGHFVLTTDERYPPACPYGPARTVDVEDPARPRQLAVLDAPENDPTACRQAPYGTYTSHNPTLTPDLAFVSWYSSGLQVFDISNPMTPARLAEYRPQFALPSGLDQQLGVTFPLTWSYPILRDGLIWVADINQGLLILRYHGAYEAEVQQTGFAEGNSNLTRVAATVPSPPATPPHNSTSPPTRSRLRVVLPGWPLAALVSVGICVLALFAVATLIGVRRR